MTTEVQEATGTEKREHNRLEERNRVTVTVISAPEAPEIERKSFFCWTHDLSVGGLKFCVHTHVPMGALLKLEVVFADPPEEFRHIGQVMWEQEFEEEGVLGGEPRLASSAHILQSKLCIPEQPTPPPDAE